MEFQEIYEAFYPLVFAFLLKQCGNRNMAEELTQETFCRALKTIDRFRGDCRLETWLCQIAKNAYLSEYRRARKFAPLPDNEPASSADDPAARLLASEGAMEALTAAHQLDEPAREVFLLRACGEQDFAFIGRLFGKSASWARVTYHRAKLRILRTLRETER